jgi:hypothetical protein
MKYTQLATLLITFATIFSISADYGDTYESDFTGREYPKSVGGVIGNTTDDILGLPGTIFTRKTPKKRREDKEDRRREKEARYQEQEPRRNTYYRE